MKKNINYIFINIMVIIVFFIYLMRPNMNTIIKTYKPIEKDEISKLKEKYNNEDIIGIINIPGVLNTPILKTTNNEFYLSHDIKKNYYKPGSVFMDYRTSFNDRKILLYGHSGDGTLPFSILNKYLDKSFFDSNRYIYLKSSDKTYKYKIISAYIERQDFDYVNVKDFGGLSFEEHLKKLASKSVFKTDYNINKDSKALILQTCSLVDIGNFKFHLVVAILED